MEDGGGYGVPNTVSEDGTKNVWRDYSRVLEINPITFRNSMAVYS